MNAMTSGPGRRPPGGQGMAWALAGGEARGVWPRWAERLRFIRRAGVRCHCAFPTRHPAGGTPRPCYRSSGPRRSPRDAFRLGASLILATISAGFAQSPLPESFHPDANGAVSSLAVQADGKILVGGNFGTLAGQPRARLARLNADGMLDADFNPGANNAVASLVLQADGKILVGGWFTSVAGQPRNYIARLNWDGTLDLGFDPGAGGGSTSLEFGSVSALAVQTDGRILVGGSFTNVGGQPRNCLGRLNPDGTLDGEYNPGAAGLSSPYVHPSVASLAVQADGKILVGGNFTILGGQARNCIGRLNNTAPATQSLTFDGTTVTWLRGGTSPEIASATFDQSVDGSLWTFGGIGRRMPGGWKLTGGPWLPGSTIRARGYVVGEDGASGWFVESMTGAPAFGAQPFSRTNNAGTVARFNVHAGGTEPLRFQWRKDGVTLEDGGNVTGTMTSVLTVSNVLGGDGGAYSVVVTNPLGSVTSAVATLTVIEPIITGQPVSQNRELGQSATFSVTALGTALNYWWYRDGVELGQGNDATLILTNLQGHDAGNYSAVVISPYGSVMSATALLTVNLATVDAGFDPATTGSASALAVQADGKVLTGAWFTAAGGQPRSRIVRLNSDGTLDVGLCLELGGYSPTVYSLAVQADGKILVGGRFTTAGGQPRNNLARLKADGSLGAGFNPGANGDVYSLVVQPDGGILIAGGFTQLAGRPRDRIARMNADRTLDGVFNPGASERVNALALQADGRILVGGWFTMLGGMRRNFIARLNAGGTLDAGFDPGANAEVYALAVQADGRILVGGNFTTLGGQPRNRIARLNADGTLDAEFDPGANSWVKSLVVQADGTILAGGVFTTLGGQVRHDLARLNPDGTVDAGFNPLADGEEHNLNVSSLAVQADGKVLAGGWFTAAGEQSPRGFARFNSTAPATQSLTCDGSAVTWLRGGSSPEVRRTTFERTTNNSTWTELGAGTRVPGGWQLANVARSPGDAIRARGYAVGGQYNGSGWFVEARLGAPAFVTQPSSRTNHAGTTASFEVLASGPEPLRYQWRKDGVAVVDGGKLTGATTNRLTMSQVLKRDEGRYRVVVSKAEGSVTSAVARLTVIDPVITGQPVSQHGEAGASVTFSVTAAGTALNYQWRKDGVALAQRTGATLLLTNLQSNDAGLYTVVVSNRYGSLISVAACLTVNLATLDPKFNPAVGGAGAYPYVYSMALQADGKIVVGGVFTNLAQQTRLRIARLNQDGTLDAGFDPGVSGGRTDYLPHVSSMLVQTDGKVVVGGNFTELAGQPRAYIGRLNPDGTPGRGFNPEANGPVYSLAIQPNGEILMGGEFTAVGRQTRDRIARLKPDGTLDKGFNPGVDGHVVTAISLQTDGKILVGGVFSTLGGQSRANIGRLNSDGTLDAGFNPGAEYYVSSLAVQADGKILVGGWFDSLGGQPRTNIARLNADGTLDGGFNPGATGESPDSKVDCLSVQADGKILVGGTFTELGGQTRICIGRLNPEGSLDAGFDPRAGGPVFSLALQANGKIVVGGAFGSLAGQPCTCLGRLKNSSPATGSLARTDWTVTWLRGGTSPEVWRTTFDHSSDGITWAALGAGARVPGGWQLSSPTLPRGGTIRARGHVAGGLHNGSAWFVETLVGDPIRLAVLPEGSRVVLTWTGGQGPYRVQQSEDPSSSNSWQDLGTTVQTNSMAVPVGTGNLFLRVRGQ